MANLDNPNGARLVGHTSGSPLNARIRQMTATTAVACFPGDFVKLVAAGTVEPAAAGDLLIGVCVGVVPSYSDVTKIPSLKYKEAAVAGTVLVCDDPESEFEIQCDGAFYTQADIGQNADIVATAGSTLKGRSQHEISSTRGALAAQLRVVGLVNRPDNDNASNFNRVIVRINEHQHTTLAGI